MFKHSVFYALKHTHPLNNAMKSYASLFNTHSFDPHVTIQSNLTKEQAIAMKNRYLSIERPLFVPHGDAKMTKQRCRSKSGHLDFYAIEQPLKTNGTYVAGIHTPLAYRINKPFTPMELAMCKKIAPILSTDIFLCIFNCESETPSEWFRVK